MKDPDRYHELRTDERDTHLTRGKWSGFGHIHSLRLGNHVACLWFGLDAWILSVPTMGLRLRADDRSKDPTVAPWVDLGPDDIEEARRWAERMIPLRIAERRYEDDLALADLRAFCTGAVENSSE